MLWILVLGSLVGACAPVVTTATIEPQQNVLIPTVENETSSAYPVPSDNPITSQPYPIEPGGFEEAIGPETYVIPEPGQDTGVVIGQLIDQSSGKALKYYSIYLANKLMFQGSDKYSYTLDPVNSPHTIGDSQGRFAIGDVPPGNYIVMVWTPIQASVVIDAGTNLELNVEIVAGEIFDVGSHSVTNPVP